jgi:hypothetical protein
MEIATELARIPGKIKESNKKAIQYLAKYL